MDGFDKIAESWLKPRREFAKALEQFLLDMPFDRAMYWEADMVRFLREWRRRGMKLAGTGEDKLRGLVRDIRRELTPFILHPELAQRYLDESEAYALADDGPNPGNVVQVAETGPGVQVPKAPAGPAPTTGTAPPPAAPGSVTTTPPAAGGTTGTAGPGTLSPQQPGTTRTQPGRAPSPGNPPPTVQPALTPGNRFLPVPPEEYLPWYVPWADKALSYIARALGPVMQIMSGPGALGQGTLSAQEAVGQVFVWYLHPLVEKGVITKDFAASVLEQGLRAVADPRTRPPSGPGVTNAAKHNFLLHGLQVSVIVQLTCDLLASAVEDGTITLAQQDAIAATLVRRLSPADYTTFDLAKFLAATTQLVRDEAKRMGVAVAAPAAAATGGAGTPAADGDGNRGRPIFLVRRSVTPEIAAHDADAIAAGKPSTLTRVEGLAARRSNRAAALRGHPDRPDGQSLDEYPFASTLEGGDGASVRAVPKGEQDRQGADLSNFYQQNNMVTGRKFDVKIVD